MELSARERDILSAIIQDYIMRKEPIGSRTLSKDFDLGISAATIRNTMIDLEDKELIFQPYSSAGRLPTDSGYRFYVSDIMEPRPLSRSEITTIWRKLLRKEMYAESILAQAAKVVSMISSQLGIILAPSFEEGVFEHLQLVPIHSNRVMLILTIRSRLIKTVTMEVESDLDNTELSETEQVLNQRLNGLTIQEIRCSIHDRMADVSQGNPKIISLIIEQMGILFQFDDYQLKYVGASNLLEQPEFLDISRLKSLFDLLEEREQLAQLLKKMDEKSGDVTIIIGHENTEERLQECSIVAAHYSVGHVRGVLGIVGPTRMSYSRLITLVRYTADVLSRALEPA